MENAVRFNLERIPSITDTGGWPTPQCVKRLGLYTRQYLNLTNDLGGKYHLKGSAVNATTEVYRPGTENPDSSQLREFLLFETFPIMFITC